jgi:hypothetical protein
LLVDIRSLCGVEHVMLFRWTAHVAARPADGVGLKVIAGYDPGFGVAAA